MKGITQNLISGIFITLLIATLYPATGEASTGLQAPTGIQAKKMAFHKIKVTWKKVPGAKKYAVNYKNPTTKARKHEAPFIKADFY